MYMNKIDEINTKDVTDEELVIINFVAGKQAEYAEENRANEIAHYLMLWLKYYRMENTTYECVVKSLLYERINFNEDKIIEKSKQILLDKYKINVISDDPMILASEVPFSEIEE